MYTNHHESYISVDCYQTTLTLGLGCFGDFVYPIDCRQQHYELAI